MEIRFNDHLSLKISVPNSIKNVLLPGMILQPIVENSIKHGYSNLVKKLHLDINIYKKKNKLVIEIFNNGKPIKKEELRNGNGLNNIQERLETLFGEDYEFHFYNLDGKGVITIIIIPYSEQAVLV